MSADQEEGKPSQQAQISHVCIYDKVATFAPSSSTWTRKQNECCIWAQTRDFPDDSFISHEGTPLT